MDIRKIKKLIDLLQETGVAEIEIKEGEESVRISRQGSVAAPVMHAFAAPATSIAPTTPSAGAAATPVANADNGHVIKSPMVGTYYASASPQTPPLVAIGSAVKKGDTLCVIEAMKIMNQIQADQDGTVAAIHAENGQPVEFDQPLFTLR